MAHVGDAESVALHALHDKRDGRVAFGEREEGLPAQSPENIGLGKSHSASTLALSLGFPGRAGRIPTE